MNNTPHRHRAGTAAPLGIWPCDPTPAEQDQLPELAERVTPALLRQVVAHYSRPGDTIVLAGGLAGFDPAAFEGAAHLDDFDFAALPTTSPGAATTPTRPDRAAHTAVSGEQPATVALIVAALAEPSGCDPDTYRRWRQRLRPGGVLVALTNCPAGAVTFANNAGIIVTAATAAGLVYQQHIVAIHARMANQQLLVSPGPGPVQDSSGTPVQQAVHSDVLVFTKPGQPVSGDIARGGR